MRLIDADKLYNEIEGKYKLSCGQRHLAYRVVLDDICNSETIEPVKRGKWHDVYLLFHGMMTMTCSCCKNPINVSAIYGLLDYCPNCGAKMDLSNEASV